MPYSRNEYLKSLNKMRDNYQNQGNPLVNREDDNGNVGNELSSFAYMDTQQPAPEQASTGKNKDFLHQLFGTVDEIASQFGAGFIGAWEGGLDLIANFIGALGDWTKGWDSKIFTNWAKQDIGTASAEWVKTYANLNPWAIIDNIKNGNYSNKEYWESMGQGAKDIFGSAFFASNQLEKDYREDSKKYYGFDDELDTEVGKFLGEAGHTIGFMLPSIMTAGGAGSGTVGAKVLSTTMMGVMSGGKSSEQALNEGANASQALAYGALSGAVEAGTEWIPFPGGNKASGVIGGKFANKAIKEIVKEMVEEGTEEVVSELMNPLIKAITYDKDAIHDYGKGEYWGDVAKAFGSGAIMGGVFSGVHYASMNRAISKDGIKVVNDLQDLHYELTDAQKQNKKGKISDSELKKISLDVADRVQEIKKEYDKLPEKYKNNLNQMFSDPKEFKKNLKDFTKYMQETEGRKPTKQEIADYRNERARIDMSSYFDSLQTAERKYNLDVKKPLLIDAQDLGLPESTIESDKPLQISAKVAEQIKGKPNYKEVLNYLENDINGGNSYVLQSQKNGDYTMVQPIKVGDVEKFAQITIDSKTNEIKDIDVKKTQPKIDGNNLVYSKKPQKIISDVKRQSSTVLIEAGADVSKPIKYRLNSVKEAFRTALEEVVPVNATYKLSFEDVKSSFAELNLARPKDRAIALNNMVKYLNKATVEFVKTTGNETVKLGDILTLKQADKAREIMSEVLDGKAEPTKLARWVKSLGLEKIKGKENVNSIKLINRIDKSINRAMKNYFGSPNTPLSEVEIYKTLLTDVKAPFTNADLTALTTNIAKYYNDANIGGRLQEFGIETNSLIQDLSNQLAGSIERGRPLTAKQIVIANNILRLIYQDVKQLNVTAKDSHVSTARPIVALAQALPKAKFVGNAIVDTLRNIDWSTRSPINIFINALGEKNPFTIHIRDGGKLCSNNQTEVRRQWNKLFTDDYLKESGLKSVTSLKGKVNAFESIEKDYVMSLISTVNSVGVEKIQKYGFVYQYENGNYSKVYYPTQEDVDTITKLLSDSEGNYRTLVQDNFFNKISKEYAQNKMKEIAGVYLETENNYFPTSRKGDKEADFISKSGTINPNDWGLSILTPRVAHSSQPYVIKPFTNVINGYTSKLTQWGEWANWYKQLKIMENTRVFGTTFTAQMREKFGVRLYDKLMEFVHKTALGMPLDTKISFAGNIFDKVFGNLQQVAMLDLFTQTKTLGSMATLYQFFGTSTAIQGEMQYIKNRGAFGDKRAYDVITELSPTLLQRFKSNIAFSANISKEVKGKINTALSSVVRTLDMHIHIGKAWAMSQVQAQTEGYGEPWSESNNKRAIRILEQASDATQPTTSKFAVGMYRAGANGQFIKRMFGMFASMGQNIYQGLYDVTVGWVNGVERTKALEQALKQEDERIAHYEDEYKKAVEDMNSAETDEEYQDAEQRAEHANYKQKEHKQTRDTINEQYEEHAKKYTFKNWINKSSGFLIGAIGSGIILTLIASLKKRVYGTKEWKDWDAKELTQEAIYQSFVNWIPYIGTIANSIKNDRDLTVFTMSNINDTINAFKNLFEAFKSGDAGKITGSTLNALTILSAYFGIPAQSIWKLVNGIWYNVDHGSNIVFKNWLGMMSANTLKSNYTSAVKNKEYEKAYANIEVWLYNNSVKSSKDVIDELYRLNANGISGIVPSAYIKYYENETGDRIDLTSAQINAYRQEYNLSNKSVSELLKLTDYKKLDDKTKASLISKVYSAYRMSAKARVMDVAPNTKLAQLVYYTNGDVNLAKYIMSLQQLSTISGDEKKSRKDKVVKAINKMSGYTKQEKLLLAYLSGYAPSDTNKNQLINYLVGKGFSKDNAKVFLGL